MTRARHYAGAQRRSQSDQDWLSWLDISRYDPMTSWDLDAWAQQMSARAALWSKVKAGQPLTPQEVEDLRERPMIAGGQRIWLSLPLPINDLCQGDVEWLRSAYEHPLISASVGEWEKAGRSQETAAARMIARAGSEERTGPQLHPETLRVMRRLLDNGAREAAESLSSQAFLTAFLKIDLSATDATLKEWFATWLKSRRHLMRQVAPKSGREGGPFKHLRGTKAEFSRWRRLAVVPYMDVLILAKHEKRRMPTAHVLGDRLLPSRRNPEVVVQQQTKVLARQFLRDGIANHLRNLVLSRTLKKNKYFFAS